MGNPRWSAEWARTRRAVLARDGWVCQLGMVGCTGRATQADHIVPRRWGGDDSMANLRAACGRCNRRRSDGLTPPPQPAPSVW